METIERAFGQVIRQLRKQAGFSQEAFADHAGIHRTYMSSIELGKVQVSIAIAEKLARALKISVGDLFQRVVKLQGETTKPRRK